MRPPRTAAPAPLRRDDYRAPDWLVPAAELRFELEEDRVRVAARLEVWRNGNHRAPLRLDGEGLKLVSVLADGRPVSHKLERDALMVRLAGDSAVIDTVVELVPGSEQRGLFALDDALCTQCEPQGFRRVSFFPDRPDVLTRFRVRIAADAARFPVLLSNGNRVDEGQETDGRHWVEWDDPWPKPCYLFSLVAGDLACRRDHFVTRSGRKVALGIWARPEQLAHAEHAMNALKAAMAWDEQAFGREYDLDRLDLVALGGFQFGAVEAKGLNIFDAGHLLAHPERATDADLAAITTLVGHEYLHNWSGNRVTIRDWFELGLKEGLTVFRDQEFVAARGSAAVKRIHDVKALRAAHFDSHAEPSAIRPSSLEGLEALYGTAAYVMGAEVVRMLRTLIGPEAFRAGVEAFFVAHDGNAATHEDLLAALSQASGRDLGSFAAWYAHRGVLQVRAELRHDPLAQSAVLTLEQDAVPPLPVPLRAALVGPAGQGGERVLLLQEGRQEFVWDDVHQPPSLSINRGFSAPVELRVKRAAGELALLAGHDTDPFARWDAMQALLCGCVAAAAHDMAVTAIAQAIATRDDPGLVAELCRLPPLGVVIAALPAADPGALQVQWLALRDAIGRQLEAEWRAIHAEAHDTPGGRSLRAVALDYLLAAGARGAGAMALRQLEDGPTMTDRLGALQALCDSDAPERLEGIAAFHRRWRDDPVLLDRWFSAQALSVRPDTIETAPRLLAHPDFTLAHPTRLSAIVDAFGGNAGALHHASGRGYSFLADVALAADRMDPRSAVRIVRPLLKRQNIEAKRAAMIDAQLERLKGTGSRALRQAAAAALAGDGSGGGT
jgi:aminopeptidase N